MSPEEWAACTLKKLDDVQQYREAEIRSRRGPFIVRAARMFNVPTSEVTLAQYAAAVERTEQDAMPPP